MATSTPGKRRGTTATKTDTKASTPTATGTRAPRKPAVTQPRQARVPKASGTDMPKQAVGSLFPDDTGAPATAAPPAKPPRKPATARRKATPPVATPASIDAPAHAPAAQAVAASDATQTHTAPMTDTPKPTPAKSSANTAAVEADGLAQAPVTSSPAQAETTPATSASPSSGADTSGAPNPAQTGMADNDRAPFWQTFADTAAACSGVPGALPVGGEMFNWLSATSRKSWPIDPEALSALQSEYVLRFNELFERYLSGHSPELKDNRFAGQAWKDQPAFGWQAAWYLFNAEFLKRSAELVEMEDKARDRLRFFVQQWVDAMSPANFFASNPEAQTKMLETKGESLRQGINNLMNDIQQGRISQTDLTAFEVGKNVCVSPGVVVYENELVQLIQYQPSTPKVGERPLLVVPPAINKFYILDLQPTNSFIGHAVAEGHTVFVISWRNIKDEASTLSWDDYLQKGIVDPIHVVQEISGQQTLNMLGFCVGGTLLATALAALAAKGERPAESLTLLTTLLDFMNPGVLGVFIDEMQIALREQTIGKQGIMPGKELALTFSFLRPNELVWNYVVGNYLKGETPMPFDLLYWNADSTNLAGPMFCTYLRHLYLQNELSQPGKLKSLGVPIDLRAIDVPTYILCAREDHIVPWQGGFTSAKALGGDPRFVLAASGHIAGVVNPPAKKKRSYQVGAAIDGLTPDEWLASAETFPGSWWTDWYQWLADKKGKVVDAPAAPGSSTYQPIEPAPGRYVKEKV